MGHCVKCAMNKSGIVHKRAVRYIGFENYMDYTSPIFKELHFLKLQNLQDLYILIHHTIATIPGKLVTKVAYHTLTLLVNT